MGLPVLILGRSGSGKSRSLKNFTKDEIGVIKAINKRLPFRNELVSYTTQEYSKIKAALLKASQKSMVIDDAGYLLTGEFMNRMSEKGYDKFTELANNFYELITYVNDCLPEDKIVYIIMHEDENEITGLVKPKTIGKLLDEKVCVEGMFTIVLRCRDYKFITNGSGCAKTPEEMFEETEIENDLKIVDNKIREYYNL